MRALVTLLVLGLSVSISPELHAQPNKNQTQADISAQADEQFRRGREEQNRGNCQKALEYFRASHALKPQRGTLLNMGLCEKQLGQLAKAMQHLEEVLPQLPQGDDRRDIVRENLTELKAKVPWLRIVLTANAPVGTIVTYDDSELEPTMIGTDIPVDPGKHVVIVEATGLPNRRYEVMIEEGKRQTLRVEPGVLSKPVAIKEEAPQSKGKLIAGVAAGGVGVLGVVAGAITGGMALRNHSAAEKACPTRNGCNGDTLNLVRQGETLSTISTVAFAVGVVGLGVGVPLVLTNRNAYEKAPTVGLVVSPYGASVGLSGAF